MSETNHKKITIVGAGIVGQAAGTALHKKGHSVTFVDINKEVLKKLKTEGYSAVHIDDIDGLQTDYIFISISTPMSDSGSVDLTNIKSGMKTVGKLIHQSDNPLLVFRSTVPPGTCEEILIPIVEKHTDKKAFTDFGVIFNPEFLRAKSALEDFEQQWVCVIGHNPNNKDAVDTFKEIIDPFVKKSNYYEFTIKEAELFKYVHNNYNALKISFFNNMWFLAKKIGIEDPNRSLGAIAETAEGMWNPRYGTKGGQPYGGFCLTKDTNALHNFALSKGIFTPMIAATIEVNQMMERLAENGEIEEAETHGLNWMPSPVETL